MTPNHKPKEDGEKLERHDSGPRERAPQQAGPQVAEGPHAWTAEDASVIERLLDDASERLAQTPETPLRRELYLVVERYRHALREWRTQPPTHLQQIILVDCVKALQHRVASRSWGKLPPTGR